MTKSQKATGQSGQVSFTSKQLEDSLLELHDLLWRCLLQTEFIVVGEMAKQIRDNLHLSGNKLEVIIYKDRINDMVRSTLKEWTGDTPEENSFSTTIKGVPVLIYFVADHYPFLTNADLCIYGPEQYKIPNPIEEYEKHVGRLWT